MKKLLYLIISLCLVPLVHCATEQKTTLPTAISQEKCDAPIWNIGDSWRYSFAGKKEGQLTVERIEGDLYIVEDKYGDNKLCYDKKKMELKFYLSPGGKKNIPTSEGIYFDFPLYVGKKWSKMVSGQYSNRSPTYYLHEFKAVSFEDVAVRAGIYKAFKIDFSRKHMSTMGYVRTYIWYSPEVKNVVKSSYVTHDEGTQLPPGWRISQADYELVSFKSADKQPPSLEKKSPPQGLDTTINPQTPLPEKPPILKPTTPPPAANIVVVTGTSANIRSGAGNEFSITTTAKQRDKLFLLGEHRECFNVRLENGQERWINSRFVKER